MCFLLLEGMVYYKETANKRRKQMRACGILLPIASLPGSYGIGSFSKEAYKFVDQLNIAGQKYWQILPLGPTGYGDSPYQSFSTFAGNPNYIDLEDLIDRGWICKEECCACEYGAGDRYIDYEQVDVSHEMNLRKAFHASHIEEQEGFWQYCRSNEEWLEDYALYMTLKKHFNGKSWCEWELDIRLRHPEAMEQYRKQYQEELLFYRFQQYMFHIQWNRLKNYANSKGIQIIGDLPIYVAFDSVDTWANPELFQLNEVGMPVAVAGCPPDGFAPTGQLWGNPLYQWEYHKNTGYQWWISRIKHSSSLYDVIRIDHFRGFDEYYSIPFGNPTAEHGNWKPGPGYEIFQIMNQKLGELHIIAEDLGYLTDSVRELVRITGYPGMKVLEFAFDAYNPSEYLPYHYSKHCVVYTGTHDNNTVKGWFLHMSHEDRRFLCEYIGVEMLEERDASMALIRLALGSVADLCMIPIQDYLNLGEEARMNEPSTVGNNWKWRLVEGEIKEELLGKMNHMSRVYGRL
ncbi:MAG: 4-alpha-glucanotransferase [Lachnospiraceae bacterium]